MNVEIRQRGLFVTAACGDYWRVLSRADRSASRHIACIAGV